MKIKNNTARFLLFSLFFFLAAFMPSSFAFAQSASEMDAMLHADTVSAARAVRFVLGAADLLQSGISAAEAERVAYDMAASNGWIKAKSDESITMRETAFLIMKAFNMKGGIMYSIFKNPRYAYREMVYRNLIPGRMNGNIKVTGSALLAILDRVTQ